MHIKVIGSHGGTAPGYRTSCYQINEHILIDCGSAASGLSLEQQFQISDIFITHPHLDHVKDICFLIENTFNPRRESITLRSSEAVLNDVHQHLLNDVIWPDFSKIYVDPQRSKTILKYEPMKKSVELNGLKFEYETVNHPVNAVGYIVDDGKNQVVFSGDTGPTEAIWSAANKCSNLRAIFTEISFPSKMDGLARASGHFTTQQLLDDLGKIQNLNVPIYIAHFKPQFFEELMEEFHTHAPKRIHLLHQEDEFEFN